MSCVAAVVENVSSTPLTLVCGGGGGVRSSRFACYTCGNAGNDIVYEMKIMYVLGIFHVENGTLWHITH